MKLLWLFENPLEYTRQDDSGMRYRYESDWSAGCTQLLGLILGMRRAENKREKEKEKGEGKGWARGEGNKKYIPLYRFFFLFS